MTIISTVNDETSLTLTLVADFGASLDRVWEVWEAPRQLERWWGPPTFPATFTRHDFVVGGESRYFMTGPDGETPSGWWRIDKLVRPQQLEFANGLAGDDGEPMPGVEPMATRITFETVAGRTRMSAVTHFVDVAQMETMLARGMQEGMTEAVGQIDALLSPTGDRTEVRTAGAAPVSGVDLFTDEARLGPYERYEALRALGPVVYLAEHNVYALARYQEVREVLDRWQLYSSAQGVTMNPGLNDQLKGVITLFLDPPEHETVREVLGRPLRPHLIRALAPRIEAEAEAVVERLVEAGTFDAATDLAEHLPMTVVSELVGLGEHGRSNMLRWAAATWESQGPPNTRAIEAGPVVEEFLSFAVNDAIPGNLEPDGWAAQLYAAADAGDLPRDKCPFMMVDYVTPSLDTTIYAISNAIRLFAQHPEQWDLLRSNPSLVPHAINETLRLESPVQQFTRVATEAHELGGVQLAEGDRVMLLYGSANRDERKYPDPERFDITRMPSDHLAFGRGEHVCIGMQLARLEMSALLRALATRVRHFEIVSAEPLLSNVLNGMKRLEVTVS